MPRRLVPCLLACLLAAAAGGHAAQTEPPPVLDGIFAAGRQTLALEALEARAVLGPGESQRVVEVARDAHSSHHVVTIRERETPHVHERHDLLVVMLEGFGSMWLGDDERAVGRGSILYVPRGTPHAFRNGSDAPAVAFAVYFPPFDGRDRTAVDE